MPVAENIRIFVRVVSIWTSIVSVIAGWYWLALVAFLCWCVLLCVEVEPA